VGLFLFPGHHTETYKVLAGKFEEKSPCRRQKKIGILLKTILKR
jgi:hypothetical protein